MQKGTKNAGKLVASLRGSRIVENRSDDRNFMVEFGRISWRSIFSLYLGRHEAMEQSKEKGSARVDLFGHVPKLHAAQYALEVLEFLAISSLFLLPSPCL